MGSPDTLRVTAEGHADPASEFWFGLEVKCSDVWGDYPDIETDGEVTEFTAIWDVDAVSELAGCDSVRVTMYELPFGTGDAVADTTMATGIEGLMAAPAGLDVEFYPGLPPEPDPEFGGAAPEGLEVTFYPGDPDCDPCILQMPSFTVTAKPDSTVPGFWIIHTHPEPEECNQVPDYYLIWSYIGDSLSPTLVDSLRWVEKSEPDTLYWHEYGSNGMVPIPCDEWYFFWVEHRFDEDPDPPIYECDGAEIEAYEELPCEFGGAAPTGLDVEFYPDSPPLDLAYVNSQSTDRFGFRWSPTLSDYNYDDAIFLLWDEDTSVWTAYEFDSIWSDTPVAGDDSAHVHIVGGWTSVFECDSLYTFAVQGADTLTYWPTPVHGPFSNTYSEYRVCCNVPDVHDVVPGDQEIYLAWEATGDGPAVEYVVYWIPQDTGCPTFDPGNPSIENSGVITAPREYTITNYPKDGAALVNGTDYCVWIVKYCTYSRVSDPWFDVIAPQAP